MSKKWFFPLLFSPGMLHAQQQVISSAGLQQTNSGVMITATVGEPFIALSIQDDQWIAEGFQQGFIGPESYQKASEREEIAFFQTRVFPNPATDFIQLQVQEEQVQSYRLTLRNTLGVTLLETEFTETLCTLDLRNMAPGQYWISVQSGRSGQMQTLTFSKTTL
jgi:hypothetical protein